MPNLFKHLPNPNTLEQSATEGGTFVKPTVDPMTWTEEVGLGMESFARSGSAFYSEFLYSMDMRDRNAQIDNMVDRGDIPEDIASSRLIPGNVGEDVSSRDYESLAQWAQDNLSTDILDDSGLLELQKKKLEDVQKRTQELTGFSSNAAMMVGTLATALSDPMYWPTYFVGGPVLRAASLLAAAKVVSRSVGVELLMETAQQERVMDWRKEIGAEYDYKESLKAIMIAGIAGGVAPIALEGVSMAVKGGFNRLVDAAPAEKLANVATKLANKARRSGASAKEVAPIREAAIDMEQDTGATIAEHADGMQGATQKELKQGPIGGRVSKDAPELVDPEVRKAQEAKAEPEEVLPKEEETVDATFDDADANTEIDFKLTDDSGEAKVKYGSVMQTIKESAEVLNEYMQCLVSIGAS